MSMRLQEIKAGCRVRGIAGQDPVTVVAITWHGSDAVDVTYKNSKGEPGSRLLLREDEPSLELVEAGIPWAFDADGALFRLAAEAQRIRLAYLFDPLLAVHTSLIDPLPHQITAVYEEMLPRQPLRFLLADDPGAGKTIMSGLLIKELRARGDVERCLIVCPGMLAEQWQDELWEKFHLPFEILTNDKLEASRSGNWFQDEDLVVARLDKLSRDEDVQEKFRHTDWDLIVIDEAHKMSATVFGNEVKYTKRHHLGQLLSGLTRHLLLLTATPHNGKEQDFQLFLSLLDADRFAGRFREGVHTVDVSDLMRRLSKEQLLKFDKTPLFPERRAHTVEYALSEPEVALYAAVTEYVREEFNRADRIENGNRRGTVGFALTGLQRRLASSPEAIYQSLRRRREKLERRLEEERLMKRGLDARINGIQSLPELSDEQWDDLDEAPSDEFEATEERIMDAATASQTIAELEEEILTLKRLEGQAAEVRSSRQDTKWNQLRELLLDREHLFDENGHRRKLVLFTEHRDTLRYLEERIGTLLGKPESIVTIHGGLRRDDRRDIQLRFTQDKDVHLLLATDAAGEGINLQRAHLMVNYDLPWNPNRLEQRFGRIHRIGQTEVCHVWNLCAHETREGDVFLRLLRKLERERKDLPGPVFDILGTVLSSRSLRELLIEAIRYGEQPEVRARLQQAVDDAFDPDHIRKILNDQALTDDVMDAGMVLRVREEMERADARRLQPHFIESFFREAFHRLGGTMRPRKQGRYEITHVPSRVRTHDRVTGTRERVQNRYERVTFHRDLVSVPGEPVAAFLSPGHPLLESTADILLEEHGGLLRQGAILVDPDDDGDAIRALYVLEHTIRDARSTRSGLPRTVSRRMHFVEIEEGGKTCSAGSAPYLDYRPIEPDERELLGDVLKAEWLAGEDLEGHVVRHAVEQLVPAHVSEVRSRREALIDKTMAAVKERLTKEITYWDHRAQQLKVQEEAGRQPRMNWLRAKERADELQSRLCKRMEDLEQQRQISPLAPIVIGGALIVPQGLLTQLKTGQRADRLRETEAVERAAMDCVLRHERDLGYEPRDVGDQKLGYDVESRDPETGALRFIEVKGRAKGATTVTVTKNEILTALNKPESFILALVEVDGRYTTCRYVRGPFEREPDFNVTSVNYVLSRLWERGEAPQ